MIPTYEVILSFRMVLVILSSFYPACEARTTRFLTTYTIAQDALLGSSFTCEWKYELANGVSVESLQWILDPSSAGNVLINAVSSGALGPANAPGSYSGRIKWTGDLSKFTASFLLMNITSGDANQYQIRINFGPGVTELIASVSLNILEPAHFTVSPPSSQSLTEGQDLTLKCEAGGKPQPNVTWVDVLNGQVVQKGKGSSTLQINKIARPPGSAVSHVYECQAVNIHGRAAIKKETRITVQYKATIVTASSSTNTSSYIGQKVTLTCVAEGVPVPTLEWIKPGESPLKPGEQSNRIAVDVDFKTEADFGPYKCSAKNILAAADVLTIYINQLKKPGQPIVTFSDEDIQASFLTIKWSPPADDGGSAVTGYRVSVPEAGFDKTYPMSDTAKEAPIGPLTKNTNYTLLVYARNVVGEGQSANKSFTTKFEGAPEVVTATDESTKDPHIFTISWNEPISNGADVKGYDIYKRENGTDEWVKVQTLNKDARSFNISLSPGANYQIVVTATNKFGESIKENWVTIDIPQVSTATTPNVATTEGGTSGGGTLVGGKTGSGMIIGVAVGAVLFVIITVALGFFLWRRRRHQENKGHGRSSSRHIIDGSAGQRIVLQNLGAGTEGTYDEVCGSSPVYAQADTTKKMRDRSRGATPSRSNFATEAYENPGVILSNSGAQFSAPPSEYMPLAPSTRSWELKRSNINVIKIIGKGAFSKVGKATATGLRGVGGEVTVAAKMLKENAPNSDRRDLLAELELMKTFKPHPHVIKLLGCVTESEPPMVVIEYVPYGDLLGYLRKSRGLNDTYYKNPDVKPRTNLTSQQLMKFAWQIADGMSYLASKKVIHRDLAARNVLVGEGEKCKVTDFGMARDVHQDDIYTKRSRGRLPVKWTAYESLLYGVYTTQSDVWSYGIVMYEIFTIGGRPYPNVDARRIAARLQEGYRMSKPAHLEDRLYSIMTDCWKENPSERPTFSELKGIMAKMERNHRTYINLGEYDGSLYVNLDDLGLPLRS